MYTAFYGLREKPFALSPDPRFLYLAASHREALAHLLYGIEQGEGFISITGEVGTGKTTLCRTLLERLEGHIELAFLFNPSKSALELLQSICAEFGLPAEGLGRRNLMSQLNKFLLEQKERGRRVLLIIDEAQTLSENTLEQVRLLSNLETSSEKLIQILLLGQPELDRKLDERGLRQLRQRISVRWKLEPLGAPETLAYVRHRISIAAGEPKELFSESALREVHRRTGGIPRLVNQLCDRALLAGYAARAAQIGPGLIRAAAREIPDVRDPRDGDPRSSRALLPAWMKRPWMYFAMTLGLVGLSLAAGLMVGRSERAPASRPPSVGARGAGDRAGGAGSDSANVDDATSSSAAATDKPLGRLIGYVDADGYLLEDGPGAGAGAATSTDATAVAATTPADPSSLDSVSESADSAAGDPTNLSEGVPSKSRLAELRATDAQLAQAGLDAALVAGAARSAALRTADGRPALGRSAVAPGVFRKLLADRPANEALAESEQAFLDLYDLASSAANAAPASAEALSHDLESRGLMATAFDGGTLDMLRRLDHPALIPVALDPVEARAASAAAARAPNGTAAPTPATIVPEKNRRWLALTGFDGDRVWLAGLVANRVVSVAQAELAPHWLEAGIIVWKNHEALASRVERGASQSSVHWLQTALAELRYFDGPATGHFDARTADALRDFQSRNGLTEDGVVGPLTQIALYAQLDRYPVPRLSLGSVRPAPPPLGAAADLPVTDALAASSPSPPSASSPSPTASLFGPSSLFASLIASITPPSADPAPSIPSSPAPASAPSPPAAPLSSASDAARSTLEGVTAPPAVSAPPPTTVSPSSLLHGDRG